MLRVELWRSTPFRLAITFGCVFIAAFVATGFATYLFLAQELLQDLDDSIRGIHTVVASTYSTDDLEDLISTVNTYASLSKEDVRIFSVTDKAGNKIAGNFTASPVKDGISNLSSEDLGLKGNIDYRVFAGPVGDKRLIVGQSMTQTDRLEKTALVSLIWASLLVVAVAVISGIFLAANVQQRLDGIANAMNAVSLGQFDARVPLRGNGDDIDGVSRQINEALERLSVLMETTRQVSADIAHELKTPLNRLKMQIEGALNQQELGQTASSPLRDALDEVDQINATFEALLRISQIEAGARKARFRELDLADIVLAVAEIYASVAEDNGQIIRSSVDPGQRCLVHGDRELLTQMFVNLVENAIRHCPQQTQIELGLEIGRESVVATVTDNGPGIPGDERDKVFGRLYRLDKSRTTAGTGLGLSLVRAIADLHGGKAGMEDNKPGLRAKITIPRV